MKKVFLILALVVLLFPLYTAGVSAAPCPDDNTRLCNPLETDNLEGLAVQISKGIIKLAVPLTVIIIIWIGIQFLLANGEPEKINKAKKALLWTVIGLAIILIGTGFISLIRSILELKNQ